MKKQASSQELLCRYVNGDKTVTIRDIEKQEYIEMFENRLDRWSFNKSFLKPIIFIPIFIFSVLFD